MDEKLEEFFSLPTMKRKKSVQINTKVELPVQKIQTWAFCVRGSKNPPEHTGCVEVSTILTCHFLDMCAH